MAAKWPALGQVNYLMTDHRKQGEILQKEHTVFPAVRPQDTSAKGQGHPGREQLSQPGSMGLHAKLLTPGPFPKMLWGSKCWGSSGRGWDMHMAQVSNVHHISWENREGSGATVWP